MNNYQLAKEGKLPKTEVRAYIIEVAKEIFYQKSYLGTSIRDIAKAGNLTVGRIYVYFKKKDDIFYAIIEPLIEKIEELTENYSIKADITDDELMYLLSIEHFRQSLEENFIFIGAYKEEFELALFKSEGFKRIDFRQKIIDAFMVNFNNALEILNARQYTKKDKVLPAVQNSVAKLYIIFYEEFLLADVAAEDYQQFLDDMTSFLYYGHIKMLNIEPEVMAKIKRKE